MSPSHYASYFLINISSLFPFHFILAPTLPLFIPYPVYTLFLIIYTYSLTNILGSLHSYSSSTTQ